MTPETSELLQVMKRCSQEIKDLRAHINYLKPKAEAYDCLSKVLGLLPGQGRGEGEDLAWRLDNRIGELLKEQEAAKVEKVDA